MRPTDTLRRWCTTAAVVMASSLMAFGDEGVFRISDADARATAVEQPAELPSVYQPAYDQIVRGQDPGNNPLLLTGYARRQRGGDCTDNCCNDGGCNDRGSCQSGYCNGGSCQNGYCQGGACQGNYCNGAYCDSGYCGGGRRAIGQGVLNYLFGWLIPSGCCGRGCAPIGAYKVTYADNPTYSHPADGCGQTYGVQGYGIPLTVPLAPTVRQSYNYSWGIPSSRITPVGQNVVGAVGSQPLRRRTW